MFLLLLSTSIHSTSLIRVDDVALRAKQQCEHFLVCIRLTVAHTSDLSQKYLSIKRQEQEDLVKECKILYFRKQ